jgi:pyruvate kinase
MGRVRTKIVATVGPATRNPLRLRALVQAGVDVFRLNFSHGTHEEHSEVLAEIRRAADEAHRSLAVLQDLSGPKIRLGPIAGDAVECRLGDRFTLAAEPGDDPSTLTCSYRELARELSPGDTCLFADGNVAMTVVDVDPARGRAHLEVTLAGTLRSRQGINLPDTALSISALTEKDRRDLEWAAREHPDFVALSFVRSASDVIQLQREMEARSLHARVVAKIEKPQALDDLEAILAATDVVMVARGDLGVEMDVARVPAAQKRIIAACQRARVPVITATQMLNSMEQSSRPTRAEASDVFNAVLDGADAVMLSGETAIGAYPVEAVATMSRIVSEAEAMLSANHDPIPSTRRWVLPITEVLVEAVSLTCRRLNAALLVVLTCSGHTAQALSKQRFLTPTLALTPDAAVARAMAMYWGVTPLYRPDVADSAHALQEALSWARHHGLIQSGDRVVLLRGTVPDNAVQNALLVHEVE